MDAHPPPPPSNLQRNPYIYITVIFPLATVQDSHLQRIIWLKSCIILGWEYYSVDFMLDN